VIAGALISLLAWSATAADVHAVLINGGKSPRANAHSHALHLEDMRAVLRARGVESSHITVFCSDGSDPTPDTLARDASHVEGDWMVRHTRASRLLPPTRMEDTKIEGEVLRPATSAALGHWFANEGARLTAGDTLFVYTTDHGWREDGEAGLYLWEERATPVDMAGWLESVPQGVQVVTVMSHCFAGAFASVGEGRDNACGFYAAPADRKAYGCYPEGRDKRVGHGFRFIDALSGADNLTQAHAATLWTDRTPDVPLATSDLFLRGLIEQHAEHAGLPFAESVDELLPSPLSASTSGTLRRVASTFGLAQPSSMADLATLQQALPALQGELKRYVEAYGPALRLATSSNLNHLIARRPSWRKRVSAEAVRRLKRPELRNERLEELIGELQAHAEERGTLEALEELRARSDASRALNYRMEVRMGALLRLEAILVREAGLALSTTDPAMAARLEVLTTCEASAIGTPSASRAADSAEPFPAVAEDIAASKALVPSFLGVKHRPLSSEERRRIDAPYGAVRVTAVFKESPAEAAGLRRDDVALSLDGKDFVDPHELRSWSLLNDPFQEHVLTVHRAGATQTLHLALEPLPQKNSSLVRPGVGGRAPSLPSLPMMEGTIPLDTVVVAPYLLLFWPSGCDGCLRALPRATAWAATRSVPLVVVTDNRRAWDLFRTEHAGPLPERVAMDAEGVLFGTWGVEDAPALVLVDAEGVVRTVLAGFDPEAGPSLP
jgi:hypothetical protein